MPKRIGLTDLAKGKHTRIEYDYWLPDGSPPEELFEASVENESFRSRILRYLTSRNLDAAIRAELAVADGVVQQWQEKWGRTKREDKGGS